jgi:hypothetical protein
VKSGDPNHERVGTEVRRVESFKAAFGYAAKYAAKLPEGEANDTEGRVWGVVGRRDIPSRVVQYFLDGRAEARLTRFVRNMVSSRSKHARPLDHVPKWIVIDGRQGLNAIRWARG